MVADMRVYLDTDLNFPSDDFQALLLLLAASDVQLLGCGAAAGNTWAEEVFANIHLAKSVLLEGGLPIWHGVPHGRFAERRRAALQIKSNQRRSFIGAFEKSKSPRSWVIEQELCDGELSSAEAIIK